MIPKTTSSLACSLRSRSMILRGQFPFGFSPARCARCVISVAQFAFGLLRSRMPTVTSTTARKARSAAIHGSRRSLRCGASSARPGVAEVSACAWAPAVSSMRRSSRSARRQASWDGTALPRPSPAARGRAGWRPLARRRIRRLLRRRLRDRSVRDVGMPESNVQRAREGGRVALALALAALVLAPGLAGASPQTLRGGTQKLTRCEASPLAYCGYPASAPIGSPQGTVLPVEGGPGYGSIGSVGEGYSVQYGPLLARWNMLAIDNRGTGSSTPVDCPAIQRFSGPTGTSAFQLAAAGCAEALNHRWRYPHGAWVHASDLFTSAPAAEDMASVVNALDVPKVDLYGDSYGSFFAQVFAARFPGLVRSVILDSTYQSVGLDPWYRSAITSMPAAFDAACARAPACASAAPGSSWARMASLAEYLRASSISGRVPGPRGARVSVSMDVVGLVALLNDAAADPQILRALDAAGRALLGAHDPAPLLRLYDQRLAEDEAYFGLSAKQYSGGLYLAVSCLDYPQLFDMNATSAVRAGVVRPAYAAVTM